MIFKRLALVGLLFGTGVATSACTDGYGYSGVSVGYGTGGYGYYDDGFADPYYGGYGYGGYPSYFGWYGDYYYPGTGIYVYDQYRRPYRWNDGQRRYWEQRRNQWRGDRNFRNDWNGFDRRNGWRGDRPGGPGGPGVGNPGRPDWGTRGNWRGNRQNFSGQPAPAPQPPAGAAPAPNPQPNW
jgi:hypothetical protein